MFNAQVRSDIETIDVTINNYERLANAPQAWERIKQLVVKNFTASNSDLMPLLTQFHLFIINGGTRAVYAGSKLERDFNAVLAQQH